MSDDEKPANRYGCHMLPTLKKLKIGPKNIGF